MKKLLLTIGCSGSGKSIYATNLIKNDGSWAEINRDTIRANLFLNGNINNLWKKYKFSKDREKLVTNKAIDLFYQYIRNGKNIIISDTNLSIKTKAKWYDLAEINGYIYEEKIFGLDLTFEDLYKRDLKREINPVGKDVLLNQWHLFYSQFGRKYIPNISLPKAIIIDVDGTIAKKSPIRNHYQWDLVELDIPIKFNIDLIKSITKKQIYPIFLSGRDGICYNLTKRWIEDNLNYKNYSLFMREINDTRNDRLIKEELFFNNVANNYNVIAAIDDRPRVIRLWKDLGIPNVIDVSEKYLEF